MVADDPLDCDMTDHAQRAKDLISYVLESQRQSSDLETLNEPRLGAIAQDYLTQAHAQGRRAGLEEAAGICEAEALVDDKRGYYGNEMAKAIRVRANEIIQQAKRP